MVGAKGGNSPEGAPDGAFLGGERCVVVVCMVGWACHGGGWLGVVSVGDDGEGCCAWVFGALADLVGFGVEAVDDGDGGEPAEEGDGGEGGEEAEDVV